MKIAGKVIVITGGGSGMGRTLALEMVGKGAKVFIVDINKEGMQETIALAGDKLKQIAAAQLNITDKEQVEALPQKVIDHFGGVDGLINNAGIIQPFINVKDLEYDLVERVMNINFYGTLYMCKAFLPHLIDRPEAHIVNISSMGGFMPFPGQTIYGASKAAVKLLTEGLYAELKNTNVNVTVIHPGAVNTNIKDNSGLETTEEDKKQAESGRVLSAEAAAHQIIKAMEKNKFRAMVGKDAKMLDKLYRLMPKKAVGIIVKKMSDLAH